MKPCPTSMDPLPQFLARVYSLNHPVMATINNPYEGFVDGTVNGAAWYQVFGGMQVGSGRGPRLQRRPWRPHGQSRDAP